MTESTAGEGYYTVYEEYSKTLRTWFVAYGIGAPVLLLNNDELRRAVIASGVTTSRALLFLTGVGLQVALAAVNKAVAWILYAEADEQAARRDGDSPVARKWYQRFAARISAQFWIDLLVDIVTGVVFVVGTYCVFKVAAGTG